MTGPAFLAAFEQLTGIKFRLGAHDVEAQAIALAAAFTVRDLELVILWTRKEAAKPRAVLNGQSCTWKVLFGRHGDGAEFQVFQERLGQAEEALKRGWAPAFKLSSNGVTGNHVTIAPAPAQRSDPALFEAGRAAMAATRKALSGQSNL